MSFVSTAPEFVTAAASELADIGSAIGAANAAATGPTTGLLTAGADEVSAAVASLFSTHGQAFQALTAQAAAFHDQFVRSLSAGAGMYAATEAANASPLGTVQDEILAVINAPTNLLLGTPLIGDGTNGAPGLSLIHI